MNQIFVLLLSSSFLFSLEKGKKLVTKHSSDFIVEFEVLNPHDPLLRLRSKVSEVDGKAIFKQTHSINIGLKKNEYLSKDMNFDCYLKDKESTYVYGVISSGRAKENFPFSPSRAWQIDEKKKKLIEVENPYSVHCRFDSGKKKPFPFKQKGHPSL